MFDPPITGAADTFIWIFVILISFVGSLTIIDIFKETTKKNEDASEEKL